MLKDIKENMGIIEANAEAELKLTDDEVRTLLDMIDEGYTPTDEEIAALKKFESIRLNRIPKSIDLLANLKELDLGFSKITGLSGIENLTKLQVLNLMGTEITDLSGIEYLTNLQELDLSETWITDLSGIENLAKLQKLNLSGTPITDLSGIEYLTNLRCLLLEGASIATLSGIDTLTNLRKLYLSETQITDLSGIENLTNLQALSLSFTPISNLNGIENLANLQELNLSQTRIDDLSGIENLTNLRWLSLGQTQIDSNELEKLAKLKNLTHLDLTYLKLAKIPPQLLELKLPFDTTSMRPWVDGDRGIFLYGTELTQQPISLFEQDRNLIEEYYKTALRSSENSPLA